MRRYSAQAIDPMTHKTGADRPLRLNMTLTMMPTLRVLCLPALLAGSLLAGCQSAATAPPSESAPPPPRVEDTGDCGAGRVQDRVGRAFSESLAESVATESGASMLRVLRPGEAHTLDYRAERINLRLDDQQRITDIVCG